MQRHKLNVALKVIPMTQLSHVGGDAVDDSSGRCLCMWEKRPATTLSGPDDLVPVNYGLNMCSRSTETHTPRFISQLICTALALSPHLSLTLTHTYTVIYLPHTLSFSISLLCCLLISVPINQHFTPSHLSTVLLLLFLPDCFHFLVIFLAAIFNFSSWLEGKI